MYLFSLLEQCNSGQSSEHQDVMTMNMDMELRCKHDTVRRTDKAVIITQQQY